MNSEKLFTNAYRVVKAKERKKKSMMRMRRKKPVRI